MLPTLLRRRPRWESPLSTVDRDVDRMFDRFAHWWGANEGMPVDLTAEYPVDIREQDKTIQIDAEVPGFKKDQINVSLEGGILTITAERKDEEAKAKGKQHLHERGYTRIERSFTLPAAVDEMNAEARLEDGVLHLTLQKTAEAQPRRIAVK